MPKAFVLINAEVGSEPEVLSELKKIGVYDIVARVKTDTMDKLKEIVTQKIRKLDDVRSTLTMLIAEEK